MLFVANSTPLVHDATLNPSERHRDEVIIKATQNRLLHNYPHRFTLEVQNDALAFFAHHAPWLPEITPATLIGIAQLRRCHPTDWQRRAMSYFMPLRPRHATDIAGPRSPTAARSPARLDG
jgi:hypothetical protein